ncbi:AHH domain-containing protein [Hyalangium versicolor]|uniref:AHH domain-containing protein n=1 Tax=Hyalangium versicolor TaxID=2861190 RepID=UPI001CCD5D9B|nr:AHH domain-containing protein [Hyalangium versicolor]
MSPWRVGDCLPVVLCVVLFAACATTDELVREEPSGSEPDLPLVKVSELSEERLQLTFPRVPLDPALRRFSVEDAQRALAAFREALAQVDPRLLQAAEARACAGLREPSELERTLRAQYIQRYGAPAVPLPRCLEDSPLVMALRLSPRYMPEGVREGMEQLVQDPVFLAGLATSLVVYVIAWAAPEPIFSKAFAASVTLVLALTFTVAELVHVGMVALKLYRETEGSRTLAEIEAAAERFGKALGGAGARILAYVACRGLARSVQGPPNGLGALLSPRRFALPGGFNWGTATLARAVPGEGALVVAGVAASSASGALRSACMEGETKSPGYQIHHLATVENEVSSARGGPWTQRFALIFARAGVSLEDPANKVTLLGHFGPHPEEYHAELFRRLRDAVRDCSVQLECRAKFLEELKKIADEVCTPGSRLHQLIAKSPK